MLEVREAFDQGNYAACREQLVQLEVDEEGTRAEGIGIIGGDPIILGAGPLPPPPIPVTFERPFAWVLLDERWGTQGWIGAALIVVSSLASQLGGDCAEKIEKTKAS